MAAISQMG